MKFFENNKKNKVNLRVSKKTFTEWLDEQPSYGMCNPPMDAETALGYLFDYLNIAPISISQSHDQCNTEIVYEILSRYSKEFRDEVKNWEKNKKSVQESEQDKNDENNIDLE